MSVKGKSEFTSLLTPQEWVGVSLQKMINAVSERELSTGKSAEEAQNMAYAHAKVQAASHSGGLRNTNESWVANGVNPTLMASFLNGNDTGRGA